MTVPATALAKVVEIESDRFRNLKYDEAGFQKEARAVLGEYNKNASSPFQLLNEAMQDTAYTTHTYKHTTIGFLADVKDMPNQYAYSKTFFDRWYRPENCTIVVAGDVDHEQLVKLVRQAYGTWPRGHASVTIPAEPPQTRAASADRRRGRCRPCRSSTSATTSRPPTPITPTPPRSASWRRRSSARPARSIVRSSSRSRRSSCWRPTPSRSATRACSRSSRRSASPTDVAEVRKRIESALAEAASSPIDPARLTAIKDHLRYAFAGSLDSPDAVALAVGQSIATTGRPDAMNDLYAAYDRLTPADLQRVAGRYFAPTNETVVTLESKKEASR